MIAIGLITIEQGLTLESPKAKIAGVQYKWDEDKVVIEVHFSEGNYKHSRSYEFDCVIDNMTSQECIDALFTLPLFTDNFTI